MESSSDFAVHVSQPPAAPTSYPGFFQGASNVNAAHGVFNHVGANQYNFQHNVISAETEETVYLNQLPHVPGAGYCSGHHKPCMVGTREKVLQEIEAWEVDDTSNSVYWLKGTAGSGKSAIAQTIAERSAAKGRLGASFFCSRDSPERHNIRLIFPTLAYNLAYQYTSFKTALVKIIRSSPDIEHESLAVQLERFLVRPLKSIRLSITIVVDALDECEDREPVSAILSALARYVDEIPFIITSRPEDRIRSGFEIPSLRTKELPLHDVEPTSVDQDIELYVNTRLGEIATRKRHCISGPWPSQKEIATICRKSSGLFLIASIITDFVDYPYALPQDRLKMIVATPNSTIHEGQSGVDVIYHQFFSASFEKVKDVSNFFNDLRLVVGSIVLAFSPLSRASLALASILEMSSEAIWMILSLLHSVLVVPESDSESIRICHKSLADFLTDLRRCSNAIYYINATAHHLELGTRCLELINRSLVKNICRLPRYAMNSDIKDLPKRQAEHVGPALAYACRSWAKHLSSSRGTDADIGSIVESVMHFFEHHLLSWLEVLSIEGNLGVAIYSLRDVRSWLTHIRDVDANLLNLIDDCERFVLQFFDVMEASAPHIYHSALAWSPISSLIRALYSDQLTAEAKVNPVDLSWDGCIRTIPVGGRTVDDRVEVILYSHDGTCMAISVAAHVGICDAVTGVRLTTLDTRSTATSGAFSPDDALLACGLEEGTIVLFELHTSNLLRTLTGHAETVMSLEFSPCGTMIVSGSKDKTTRIWNISSGCCECVLKGHSDQILAVCWSATGNQVISASDDTTVRLWDVQKRACSKILREHSHWATCLAFSPNADLFASGSLDGAVKIYNSGSCDVIQTISTSDEVLSIRFTPHGDKVMYTTRFSGFIWDLVSKTHVLTIRYDGRCAAFSPDGSCVTASSGFFVKIWKDTYRSPGHEAPVPHSNKVTVVSFASHGQLVASGSGQTIKIWESTTGVCSATFHCYSDTPLHDVIRSTSFSPNLEFVACLFYQRISNRRCSIVWMWNLRTHSLVGAQKVDHDARYVTPSSDGSRLVSLSKDEITLWDFTTGMCLAYLRLGFRGHLRAAFAVDETNICVESNAGTRSWRISSAPTINHRLSSDNEFTSLPMDSIPRPRKRKYQDILERFTSLPMVFVPLLEERPHEDTSGHRRCYYLDKEWILDQNNRCVFWLPPDRTSSAADFYGKKVVVGDTSGRVYVVNFSDTAPF